VLDKKLSQPQKELYLIRHSLLINAQIKLEDNNLSKDEKIELQRFVDVSGQMDHSEDYTRISKIIAK